MSKATASTFIKVLSPFAPHICEEIWEKYGNTGSISKESFPEYNEEYLEEEVFEYPVSFNGKLRLKVELPLDMMAEGWSLFHLNHINDVRLTNCTMTITNDLYSPAAFFTVQGPRQSGMGQPDSESSGEITPKIALESCMVRGQATLVRANQGLPFL